MWEVGCIVLGVIERLQAQRQQGGVQLVLKSKKHEERFHTECSSCSSPEVTPMRQQIEAMGVTIIRRSAARERADEVQGLVDAGGNVLILTYYGGDWAEGHNPGRYGCLVSIHVGMAWSSLVSEEVKSKAKFHRAMYQSRAWDCTQA